MAKNENIQKGNKMNLRETIKTYLVEWPMSDNLDPLKFEIHRLITQLDEMALKYEAKWGIGQLEAWAYSYDQPLADKFQRQVDKLIEAISTLDVKQVRDLVDGFGRAYAALEKCAEAHGHKPNDPVMFFYRVGSLLYKVVRTAAESRATSRKEGEVVVSCEELVRLNHGRSMAVMGPKEKTPVLVDSQDFDWARGDQLPPEF